jgi:hypothetical protein
MTLKLEILKIKLRAYYIIALIVFTLCSILLFLEVSYPGLWDYLNKYGLVFAILFGISAIGMIVLPLIFHNYKIIGNITIDNSKIRISINDILEKEHPFNQIKQLKFDFNETALDGGYYIRLGINNRIYITDLNDNVFKYNILIERLSIVRFIDEKLDSLKDKFEVVKKRKGKISKSLLFK